MEVHFFVDRPHSMPQRQARALLIDLLSDVLERVAYGEDAGEVADLLCRRAEILAPGAICSILCVDEELKLRPLAAPSLPAHYSEALDGLPIGRFYKTQVAWYGDMEMASHLWWVLRHGVIERC